MEIYPADIIIHIVNIVVLYLLLRVILYKPVKKFMSERTKKVEQQLEDAANTSKAAEETKLQLEARLANAENEAKEIIYAGEEKASAQASRIIQEAKTKSEKIIAKANEESEKEKKRMIDSVRGEIADISVEIAGSILKREVSPSDNKKVIDEFFSEMKE